MQKRASHQHLRGLLFSEKLLWPNQTVFKVIFRRFFSTSAFDHFLVANKEVITREKIGSRREWLDVTRWWAANVIIYWYLRRTVNSRQNANVCEQMELELCKSQGEQFSINVPALCFSSSFNLCFEKEKVYQNTNQMQSDSPSQRAEQSSITGIVQSHLRKCRILRQSTDDKNSNNLPSAEIIHCWHFLLSSILDCHYLSATLVRVKEWFQESRDGISWKEGWPGNRKAKAIFLWMYFCIKPIRRLFQGSDRSKYCHPIFSNPGELKQSQKTCELKKGGIRDLSIWVRFEVAASSF